MRLTNKIPAADRYKVMVDKLCRDVADGSTTLKVAARTQHPIVVLIAYMRVQGVTQEMLGERLGVKQGSVSLLLNGKQKPTLQQRVVLEALCSIPADHWDRIRSAS